MPDQILTPTLKSVKFLLSLKTFLHASNTFRKIRHLQNSSGHILIRLSLENLPKNFLEDILKMGNPSIQGRSFSQLSTRLWSMSESRHSTSIHQCLIIRL